MFGGHGQDYSYDTVAFALSLIPFVFVGALIAASLCKKSGSGLAPPRVKGIYVNR